MHLRSINYHKGDKNIQQRRDSVFNKCSWENWIATCKRMMLDHFLTRCGKMNSMWIKDLNVKLEKMKSQKRKQVEHLLTEIEAMFFLDLSPKAKEIKAKKERKRERPNGLYSLGGSSVHAPLFPTKGLNLGPPCIVCIADRFFTAEPPGKPTDQ